MTIDDILSRLSAGLDRDEQLARAAAEADGANWYPVDPMSSGSPDRVEGSGDGAVGYDMYETVPPHVARQDPARTLRQVEAIRKVVERYEFVTSHGPAVDNTRAMDMTTGATAALRDVLEMLASIYADPAEERA